MNNWLATVFRRLSATFERYPRLSVMVGALLLFGLLSLGPLRMGAVQTLLTITGTQPPHDSSGRTNILLLGVGDANHAGANLTDTMMLVSIEPSSRSVVLLSVPRDLYVTGNREFPSGRINTLYSVLHDRLRAKDKTLSDADASQEAMAQLDSIMSDMLGVPIHGAIKIDFTALTTAVDLLGGVDIVVPKTITDYTYPIREGVTGTFKITAGPHHLDGETALKYARTRHSGTDFDRSARQQQLIQAVREKATSLGHISQLLFAFYFLQSAKDHIETTLTTRQVLGLTQIATTLSPDKVIRTQIDYTFLAAPDPALYEGANVLLPIPSSGDPTGWKRIQSFIAKVIEEREVPSEDK